MLFKLRLDALTTSGLTNFPLHFSLTRIAELVLFKPSRD